MEDRADPAVRYRGDRDPARGERARGVSHRPGGSTGGPCARFRAGDGSCLRHRQVAGAGPRGGSAARPALLGRAQRSPGRVPVDHARQRAGRRGMDRGLRRVRLLHLAIRDLRQDVRHVGRRHRVPGLALAHQRGGAGRGGVRCGDQPWPGHRGGVTSGRGALPAAARPAQRCRTPARGRRRRPCRGCYEGLRRDRVRRRRRVMVSTRTHTTTIVATIAPAPHSSRRGWCAASVTTAGAGVGVAGAVARSCSASPGETSRPTDAEGAAVVTANPQSSSAAACSQVRTVFLFRAEQAHHESVAVALRDTDEGVSRQGGESGLATKGPGILGEQFVAVLNLEAGPLEVWLGRNPGSVLCHIAAEVAAGEDLAGDQCHVVGAGDLARAVQAVRRGGVGVIGA